MVRCCLNWPCFALLYHKGLSTISNVLALPALDDMRLTGMACTSQLLSFPIHIAAGDIVQCLCRFLFEIPYILQLIEVFGPHCECLNLSSPGMRK